MNSLAFLWLERRMWLSWATFRCGLPNDLARTDFVQPTSSKSKGNAMATATRLHMQFMKTNKQDTSFITQQAEAAQDLVVVFDSWGVAVIHRDGHLRGGDKESAALRSHVGGAPWDPGISLGIRVFPVHHNLNWKPLHASENEAGRNICRNFYKALFIAQDRGWAVGEEEVKI